MVGYQPNTIPLMSCSRHLYGQEMSFAIKPKWATETNGVILQICHRLKQNVNEVNDTFSVITKRRGVSLEFPLHVLAF